MKILVCFGTRPEAIKMAPIIHELEKQDLCFKVCVTAQHREMLDQVLNFFEIIPDYDLNLMKPGQNLNSLSALILNEMDDTINQYNPDIVLVQGDTSTAFMVSLAAFNRGIKIAHVEAGLRTYNLKSPFPEEANRQLISRIANYHFAPTRQSLNNLIEEGIPREKIRVTGNSVVDALVFGRARLENGYVNQEIKSLESVVNNNKKLILVTGHRRENLGDGLEQVCHALIEIATRKDVQIIFPVHMNPEVKKPVSEILSCKDNIHLIEPVNYPAFIWLMMKADIIISDSGGIQEEAPSLKKPVLVTRKNTERPEALESGFCFLTGTDGKLITQKANLLLDETPIYTSSRNPFGDGKASLKVIKALIGNDF